MKEQLEQRIANITENNLGVAQELPSALASVTSDPAASLTKTRRILETALEAFLGWEGRPVPEKATVGQLIKDIAVSQKIPPLISAGMQYVNTVASAGGAHSGGANQTTALRALDNLCDFLEWYATMYVLTGLTDNFGQTIQKGESLVMYASSGGTCRCAMANVITRYHLRRLQSAPTIRSMSAALHEPTRPTISPEAAQVLREELGETPSEHRSIRANERYLRRADLILAMSVKLLAQLSQLALSNSDFRGGRPANSESNQGSADVNRL